MAEAATNFVNLILGLSGYRLIETEQMPADDKHPQAYTLMHMEDEEEAPTECPRCHSKLYKHTSRQIQITSSPIDGKPVVLDIRFPRRRCRQCGYVWKADMQGIDDHHKMTKSAYVNITQKALVSTFDQVGLEFGLSGNTVKNIFLDFLRDNDKKLHFATPVFMGIDEIKIRKLGEITVITDLEHHTLYDMLPGRNQQQLKAYFAELPDNDKVLWVCSDMYRPFENAIGESLPNAKWVIDHFHVVMKANEAVDTVRKEVQSKMPAKQRVKTKKGLAYTLKTRTSRLTAKDQSRIRYCRLHEEYKPLATAFDLKEDFFAIYEDYRDSKDNAREAFAEWEKRIPADPIYDKFRELAKTVNNFYDQIFRLWDCPINISNGFTECTNRLIRENSIKGRGYSFEVLRGRTLYRKSNIASLLADNKTAIGPLIRKRAPIFYLEGTSPDEDTDVYDAFNDDDENDYLNNVQEDNDDFDISFDPETGEILEDNE